MAAGGITDILIAHLVVGPSKLARLAALQKQADVKVTVDHPDHVAELSQAASAADVTIGVLVDVDLGMKRTGVPTWGEADYARPADFSQPRLAVRRVDGLRGPHPDDRRSSRKARRHRVRRLRKLLEARDKLAAAGHPCRIISAGGSGSYQYTAEIPGITEIQAGGGIFACQYYTQMCQVEGHRARDQRPGDRRQPPGAAIGRSSTSARRRSASTKLRLFCEITQTAASSAFPPSTRRSRSNRLMSCRSEKKCTSFPVIAILLSCFTTACSECATGGSKPCGTSWPAVACNKVNCGQSLMPTKALKHGKSDAWV